MLLKYKVQNLPMLLKEFIPMKQDKELMNKKAEPKNRNEEEIAGYRHVLDIIMKIMPI